MDKHQGESKNFLMFVEKKVNENQHNFNLGSKENKIEDEASLNQQQSLS